MDSALLPQHWSPILKTLGLEHSVAHDARAAQAITFDSREVNNQTAFAALAGEHRHGNEFIDQALKNDAPFVLTDQDVPRAVRVTDPVRALRGLARAWREESQAFVVGVTGSAGKTTVKEFIAAALNAGKTPASLNTLNYLACYLLSVVKTGSSHVLEMGIDRIGEMDELVALVNPSVAVISSVGPAHMEFFGSLEKIAFEKGRIAQACPTFVGQTAFDFYALHPECKPAGAKMQAYGFGHEHNLQIHARGASYEFLGHKVHIANPSQKVAEASLVALLLANQRGIEPEKAILRLEKVQALAGRMNIRAGRFTLIDDAYNANPLSVSAALETLARFSGRKLAVLGDMREIGPDAAKYHFEIGQQAAKVCTQLVAVGEFAKDLASGAKANGLTAQVADNAETARQLILTELKDDDVVLVKASKAVGLMAVVEALNAEL